MEREAYLGNPCRASSLPFWKTNQIKVPENMKIVPGEDMESAVQEYTDERYFKLIHRMDDIKKPVLDNKYELVCCEVSEYAKHIATCYSDVGISAGELLKYQNHAVYDRDLWIAVTERCRGNSGRGGLV